MKRTIITSLTIAITTVAIMFAFGGVTYAQNNNHGYGGDRVDVCRETGSRFNPYVKVSVPERTAQRWFDAGKAIWPDNDNECPEGESIHDYIRDLLARLLPNFG